MQDEQTVSYAVRDWSAMMLASRMRTGLSQDKFADEFARICSCAIPEHTNVLSVHGLLPVFRLRSEEISRFETGARAPKRRSKYLLIAWVLAQLGAFTCAREVDDWLDSGLQGWLTDRERKDLFPGLLP